MRTYNPHVVPPEGWEFREVTGALLRADTFDDLVQRLTDYRTQAGMNAGDPFQELTEYFCKRHPVGCREKRVIDVARNQQRASEAVSDADQNRRLSRWLAKAAAAGRMLVTPSEALRRANVCAECKFNRQGWNPGAGCGPCGSTARNVADGLKGGRKTASDYKLGVCTLLDEVNTTSIWLDLEHVSVQKPAGTHETCWRFNQ